MKLLTPSPGSPVKIFLAMAFVVGCWGYSPTGIHIGLQAYEPGHLALLRFLLASAFMAVVAVFRGINLPKTRDLPLLFALGFFAVSLHHVALNFGQQSVSAGASSVLAQSTPLFSTLLARFVFKDRVSAWRWGCVFLGLIGVVIVVAGDHGLGSIDAHGVLILLAAVSWSFYFALQKHYSRRYDGLTLVCYTVWFGTLLLLVYLPGLVSQVITAPVEVQLAVIGLGIFPSALAYLAWAYVLTHVDLSRATMTLYLIPPTAMAIASFALGERPTLMIVAGALVVLVSVLALNLERRPVVARVTEA
ncbi:MULTISPECIES: DMT family transporter [unclassified Pseudomonas]|uniref:DMT family transporter n=1 Tax=unclassified Pseudomonas TaxID=196821 RepID=UPI000C87C53C|nr:MULTISPECIES: EamA family transporter [unclassified Pseudomonas]PMU08452.1 EamA family transporter [Pseudomonas sp. FW305-20]PMU14913.1 EamA family transporter [Pseudomonas sp. FW305-122]PMU36081.1 EamA family transporter [Pseudomonas sp. FW305-47B]PMX60386.1 EamA family transporter [Pseudomonas sp. FW305-33]PMX65513.1 EamA family transporter [Pseudomonas sp. FW305-60]